MICDRSCVIVSHHLFSQKQRTYLKGGSNHSLACNDSSQDSKHQAWIKGPWWNTIIEGVRIGARIVANICGLTNILFKRQE